MRATPRDPPVACEADAVAGTCRSGSLDATSFAVWQSRNGDLMGVAHQADGTMVSVQVWSNEHGTPPPGVYPSLEELRLLITDEVFAIPLAR